MMMMVMLVVMMSDVNVSVLDGEAVVGVVGVVDIDVLVMRMLVDRVEIEGIAVMVMVMMMNIHGLCLTSTNATCLVNGRHTAGEWQQGFHGFNLLLSFFI